MGIILVILALLVAIAAPILWIIFIIKRKSLPSGQIIGPLGTRRRTMVLSRMMSIGACASMFSLKILATRIAHAINVGIPPGNTNKQNPG